MLAGISDAVGTALDNFHNLGVAINSLLTKRNADAKAVAQDDSQWVPGDWGYIKNDKCENNPNTPGLQGKNIIYVGGGKYWGHFGPGNTYENLNYWINEVKSWNNSATVQQQIRFPNQGLRN